MSKRKKAAEMTERTMTSYYDRSSRGGFRPEDFSSVDEDDEEEEDKEKQGRRRRRRRQSGESASSTSSSTSSSSSAFTNFSMKMILDGEETKEIFTLAVPALGALLADPLMSLIDTMFVGRIGVNELTALGPNAAIFQVIFQLFSFLSITTTGMVARHYVKFNEGCEIAEYKTRRSVSISLFFSVAFGMVSLIALNCFASDILRLVGTPESLLATAAPYLRIRAFATPFVLASYCAQGAFIGKLDSKTPLRIFAFAAVLNFFGDFLLVPSYGLRGAAFATLFAQCASSVLFSSQLFGQKMLPKIGSPEWKSPPTATEIQRITKVSSALFFSSICRMGVYTMMTTTALHLGNAVMAAHQIALNVFWSLTYFVDPLFVASTSFIARDFERDAEKAKTIAKKTPPSFLRRRRLHLHRRLLGLRVCLWSVHHGLLRPILGPIGLCLHARLSVCLGGGLCQRRHPHRRRRRAIFTPRALAQLPRPRRRFTRRWSLLLGFTRHMVRRPHEPNISVDATRHPNDGR